MDVSIMNMWWHLSEIFVREFFIYYKMSRKALDKLLSGALVNMGRC